MCKSRLFRCCLVALSLFGLPALAQTPDGQTPSSETWCDGLKGDGANKALYGLCVAYCEAQDYSAGATKKSYEKILENYKKIQAKVNGPDMPCPSAGARSAPEPSCPCWTAAEASAVDGLLSDSSIAQGWPAPTSSPWACSANPENSWIQEANSTITEVSYIQTVDSNSTWGTIRRCVYRKMVPGENPASVALSVEFGTLTPEEHAACKADLLARQRALNVCQ